MIKKTLYNAVIYLWVAITLMVAVACSSSEDMPIDNSEESRDVLIMAKVARQLYSRGNEKEIIDDGTYYLSYPLKKNADSYHVAPVEFNKDSIYPMIGYIIVSDNEKGLKWDDVETSRELYLDNVSSSLMEGSSAPTSIVFPSDNNPYTAGVYKEDTNDLLWGNGIFTTKPRIANFELHHNMARVKVEVTVDREYEEDGSLDLAGAKVTISSINQKPIAYNRIEGSLELSEGLENYTPLILVDEACASEEQRIKWGEAPTEEDKKDESQQELIYKTQDFVLPPQNLLEDENRPRLTIELKNGTSFSGILPHAMLIDDDNYNYDKPSKPVALSFMKEHILTIQTRITEDPPELVFMPVKVVEWVDKGNYSIEAHQSGIYTAEEFYKLIEYYKANNKYQLTRYGYFDEANNEWIFDFFHSVTLEYNKIAGTMIGDINFSFRFNNYTNYIINAGGEKQELTNEELFLIVTTSKE